MTTTSELLLDGFDRVAGATHRAIDGLDATALATRPADGANTAAWLVWHIARVQDDHVAGLAGAGQVWTGGGWADRCRLPFDDQAVGYGFDAGQVGQVRLPAEVLLGYLDAVHEATTAYVSGLSDGDLDRVVDTDYDPPVTVGVRLVSVLEDNLQHAGQAAYVRGLLA
jgi:hypothetical protein